MNIFITGVAGFIGSNLARSWLNDGHRVSGLDDFSAGTRENLDPRVECHQMDVGDPAVAELLKGVDVVHHLAARNCIPDCAAHPIETAETNVRGTANVLEAVRRANVPKLVYADTSAEYEGTTEFPSRVDRIAPTSVYAVSKRAGALWCLSYAAHHGLDVTITRYFNVYGPAQDFRRVIPPVMAAFICKMLRGERPTIFGKGTKRRDFIYVDDVNRLSKLVATHPKARGETFNVGTGRNYSIREVFDHIEAILKTGIEPIYKPDLPGEPEITLADVSRERELLGWQPQLDLDEGLRRTIEYLRRRLAEEPS
jgi:UDP-glucose 4-epimerase